MPPCKRHQWSPPAGNEDKRHSLVNWKRTLSSIKLKKSLWKQTNLLIQWLHLINIMQHLDRPGTYVRILFEDFSSAFNTILPNLLLPKLTQLSVPTSVCQWITSFLTDRQQLVRLGKYTSSTRTISTGTPQGCVLSPVLFSLYTDDCTSKDPSIKLLKFADDTTLIGLIQDSDESAYRQEVKELAVWCSLNNLELNMLKTVKMIVDFRRNPHALPHSPSWTALWLQWSHSDYWAAPSLRTWSGTFT